MPTLTVLFLLISRVRAYSGFHTTCTTPPSQTNFVTSPDTRGTLDILWSYFFTIVACTWTIQHLNVPEQPSFDPRDLQRYRTLRWNLKVVFKSVKWMFVTVMVPEYVLGKALADLCAAYISKWEMAEYAMIDGVEWGLTHGFFANMGGFVLRQKPHQMEDSKWSYSQHDPALSFSEHFSLERHPSIAQRTLQDSRLVSIRTLKPATYRGSEGDESKSWMPNLPENIVEATSTDPEDMGISCGSEMETIRLVPPLDKRQQPRELQQSAPRSDSSQIQPHPAATHNDKPFHLLASEILALRQTGALPRLPRITSAEIGDKSKGDAFVKIITAFQVLWFILQVIVRAIRHLSTSQLEIAVTAFGVCAAITYFLLLQKPKNINIPITLMNFQGGIPIDQENIDHFVSVCSRVGIMGSPIPNDSLDSGLEPLIVLHFGVAVGGVIFGAIHIAAWNLSFPTLVEQTLWRTASIVVTALPPVLYLPLILEQFFLYGYFQLKWVKSWHISFGSVYVFARAFLLVEIFRTLFYLPEDAYLTTWTSNLPNVS